MERFSEGVHFLQSCSVKNSFLQFTDILDEEDLDAFWRRSCSAPAEGSSKANLIDDRPEDGQEAGQDRNQTTGWELHEAGRCQPCRFYAVKAAGCKRGDACLFCHFCDGAVARRDQQKARTSSD